MHNGNGDKEKQWWRCGGVMALMFVCRFLLFGINELEWILLDIGWMWGKGVTKRWGASKILTVEWKKEEHQSK